MVHISKHQLFTLMFIFEIGSTTLFALGIEAKQDAWIAILIALFIGLGFVWIYTQLQKSFPNKDFIDIITSILGKTLGLPLVFLYLLAWLWGVSRNLREFGELIILTTLPNSPLWIICLLFLAVSVYTLLKGMEVLARISEIILPIILTFIFAVFILLILSAHVYPKYLTPVLGEGISPILKAVPGIVFFPFGELTIFLMYWNCADDKNSVRSSSMTAVLLAGIILSITLIMDISVLGVKYTSIATIPFMEAVRFISVGDIITNIDILGVIIIFFGGFFKMSVYLYGIVLGMSKLFKIKNLRLLLVLFSMFLLWFSIVFEPNYAYHVWMSPFDAKYFGLPFSAGFPLLLISIYYIKKKRGIIK